MASMCRFSSVLRPQTTTIWLRLRIRNVCWTTVRVYAAAGRAGRDQHHRLVVAQVVALQDRRRSTGSPRPVWTGIPETLTRSLGTPIADRCAFVSSRATKKWWNGLLSHRPWKS